MNVDMTLKKENLCIQELLYRSIGLVGKVFAKGSGDWCSIQGRDVPNTQKMVFVYTQNYKAGIKGKVNQCKEMKVPSPSLLCSK